ncbi:glycosyltransferase [Achromobacter insuavis]|uniref:glycosyltransferase n=1 Tax=Achromobacter insuavis TaxID=1287735 RepID=UPI001F133FD0|nr:glycosyltransferase [Achromobacter insuavis]
MPSNERPPIISVIVPVYNCGRFLTEQLDFLLSDPTHSLEVIAVDDGSTDDSISMLRDRAASDKRLRVFEQRNQGPGAARNIGLEVATGTWIAFADADDLLPAAGLFEWLAQVVRQDLDVLVGNAYRFKGDPRAALKTPFFSRQPYDQVVGGQDWIAHCVREKEWPHYVWLQLIKRELIVRHELRFDPTILHEDVLWTTNLALVAQRMGFARSPVYGYRRHDESVVFSADPTRRRLRGASYVVIIRTLLAYAQRPDVRPDTRNALCRHVFHEVLCFVDLLRKDIDDSCTRRELAQSLLDLHPWRRVLSCVRRPADLIRVFKAQRRLVKIAATGTADRRVADGRTVGQGRPGA